MSTCTGVTVILLQLQAAMQLADRILRILRRLGESEKLFHNKHDGGRIEANCFVGRTETPVRPIYQMKIDRRIRRLGGGVSYSVRN